MQRTTLVLMICLFITACAQNSGIVQIGANKYIVSRQAATGFTGVGTLKTEAMQEAYEQCKKTGQSVDVIEGNETRPPYIFGHYPKAEIIFKCVEES